MDNRLFFLINMAQRQMYNVANARCEDELGISVTQAAVILMVSKTPNCLQKELSTSLKMNHSATTALLGRMEKNDLIDRSPCPEDGRASRINLTRKGKGKVTKIFPLIDELNRKVQEEFSERDMKVILRFLNKMKDFPQDLSKDIL